jgi:signal transduction histidine kinase
MRTPRRQVEPVDLVVALALTLAMQAEIWAPHLMGAGADLADRPALAATSLAISASLSLRRVFPWPVAVVALGAEVAQSRMETPPEGLANLIAMLLVAYSLGRFAERPVGYAGIGLVAVASFGIGGDLADHVFVLLVLGSAWVAGIVLARREDDVGALELQRLEATRAGAEEERRRIAHELHDVVAHRLSMMVVQSQLADAVLDDDPGRARQAVQAVEEAGREALAELRSALGLLHEDDSATRVPGDTDLGRLGAVVETARAGGLPAGLEVVGPPRPVPPAVAMAAFRIVQESLTNVVRHAGQQPTRVRLAYRPEAVEVVVENDGPQLPAPRHGHGLTSMTERASFLGGSLEAVPAPTGGFRVVALLPTPGVSS